MNIPLTGFTSPKINATGNLKIGDAWKSLYDANTSFSPDTPELITASVDASSSLGIGGGALAFSASGTLSAGSRLRLFWPSPKREKDQLLDVTAVFPEFDQQPADGTGPLGLLLILEGKATLTGAAPALKSGALSAALDLKTGGDLDYARLITGRQSDSVRALLAQLLSGLRLPQDPTPLALGEAIALTYGGYVKFTSKLTWGYALSGTRDVGAGSFASSIAYNAKLGPQLSFAAEAAGRYSFITKAIVNQPGWVRLSVNKSNDDSVDAAFDLSVEASYNVTGAWIDRSLYDSISLLLGLDPQAITNAIKKLGTVPTLAQLPEVLNGVFAREINTLVAQWNLTSATDVVAKIARATSAYTELDQRVHAFLADRLGQPAAALNAEIGALLDPNVLAQHLGMPSSPVWQKLTTWFAGEASDWLRAASPTTAAQQALTTLQQKVLAAADAGVHDLMAAFDPVQKVQPLVTALAQVQSPQQLQTIVEPKIQALISHLLEQPFAALSANSNVQAAFTALQKLQTQVATLQTRWADLVKKAAAQKFTAQFAASYKRVSSSESLLEADFNLANPAATAWYEQAIAGDFTALLTAPDTLVRLQRGSLDRELTRESHLSISIFGSSLATSFKLTQHTELKLESNATGHIAIDTTETAALREDDSDWFGDREKKLSRLALLSSGPVSFDPVRGRLLGSTVRIGATYDLSIEDEHTSPTELRGYLQFAEQLGLTANGDALANRLIQLLGNTNDLGKLEARYAVSFAPDAIKRLFEVVSPTEIRVFGAAARRRYYQQYYATRKASSGLPVIGYAYNYQKDLRYPIRDIFDRNAHTFPVDSMMFQSERVPMPDGTQGLIGFHSDTLLVIYRGEDRGIQALTTFDGVIDRLAAGKAVTEDEFNNAIAAPLSARESLDVFLPANYSAFFAMLDGLASYAYSDHPGVRQSKLDLTLTPAPGAKPVTLTLAA